METDNQDIENQSELKGKDKRPIEIAAEKLAAIIIAQIEFNKNKDKNVYEEKKRF